MDLQKTGLFIATLRKEKNMTQKDLAEKIGVTDKAISRWETGKGFPDVSILTPLSGVLSVSIIEIVNGERNSSEDIMKNTDNAIMEALSYSKQMSRKALGIIVLILGVGITVSPLFLAVNGILQMAFLFPGISVIAAGIFILCYKKSSKRKNAVALSNYCASAFSLVVLITALILEASPQGAVLIFAPAPNQRVRATFSYFSLQPVFYANFFPFFTAVLTAVILLLSVIALAKRLRAKRLGNAIFICTIIAFIFSVFPSILFGLDYMSIVGVAITILLLMSVGFQAFSHRSIA